MEAMRFDTACYVKTSGIAAAERTPRSLADLFRTGFRLRHYAPGSTVLLDGAPIDCVYRVLSGTIRCCTITEDGRRQIFRFARAGDFLGFVDLETWHFTAEAVDEAVLAAVPKARLDAALAAEPELQRDLRRLVARELAARERQLVMLSYARAEHRLAGFLIEFGTRPEDDGFTGLPMSRQDIADHLGMTIETVSRVFSHLKRTGQVEMQGSDRFRMVREDRPRAA